MLRLAFDFIITWRETRTRPNAYQDKYFPRESALCAMYPFARSSFLLLKHKVYLLTGYIRIIRSTDADVLLP